MRVLITGGAGYIGSFAAHRLIQEGVEVVVYDNFSTGFRESLHPKCQFVYGDIRDRELPARVMKDHKIDTVMHFAAKVVVPESIKMPTEYYENNFFGGVNLIQCCLRAGVSKFIFSSTAAVYGNPVYTNPEEAKVSETDPTQPLNPYGHSKLFMEQALHDSRLAHGLDYVILRYFNVAGAAADLSIGQRTVNANHLVKVAAEAAVGKRAQVEVFGTDYSTPDGSAIRDYIHVEDLIQAHWLVLNYLQANSVGEIFNCGYGRGFSVLEVLSTMEKVSGRKIHRASGARREGDPVQVIAMADKIRQKLRWEPTCDDLELICESTFNWEKQMSLHSV